MKRETTFNPHPICLGPQCIEALEEPPAHEDYVFMPRAPCDEDRGLNESGTTEVSPSASRAASEEFSEEPPDGLPLRDSANIDLVRPCAPPPSVLKSSAKDPSAVCTVSATRVSGANCLDFSDAATVCADIKGASGTLHCMIPDGSATFRLEKNVLWLNVGRELPSSTVIDVLECDDCPINLVLRGEARVTLTLHGSQPIVTLVEGNMAASLEVHFVKRGTINLPGYSSTDGTNADVTVIPHSVMVQMISNKGSAIVHTAACSKFNVT